MGVQKVKKKKKINSKKTRDNLFKPRQLSNHHETVPLTTNTANEHTRTFDNIRPSQKIRIFNHITSTITNTIFIH